MAKQSYEEGLYQSRLPTLTHKQQKEICGAYDFMALAYFTSATVRSTAKPTPYAADGRFYTPDACLEYGANPSWMASPFPGYYNVPEGLAFSLRWVSQSIECWITMNKFNSIIAEESRMNTAIAMC